MRKWAAAKRDVDRSDQERLQVTAHFVRFYTMCYKLNVELLVQNEANKRFHSILEGMLSHLDSETQRMFADEIENAKVISVKEVEEWMKDGGIFPRLATPMVCDIQFMRVLFSSLRFMT